MALIWGAETGSRRPAPSIPDRALALVCVVDHCLSTLAGGCDRYDCPVRVGLFFDLRNPPGWRRPWADHYAQTLELVEEADRLGIGSFWLSEHHFFEDGYLTQPFTMLAAMAARTKRPDSARPSSSPPSAIPSTWPKKPSWST